MTAATNPQTVGFAAVNSGTTLTVSPLWRYLQIDNQTNGSVTVTVQTLGGGTTFSAVTVATLTTFAVGMATALANANLIAGDTAQYDDSTVAPIHSEGIWPQDQGSNVNWTAQTLGQNGVLGGQVVLSGSGLASGNVYLSWL